MFGKRTSRARCGAEGQIKSLPAAAHVVMIKPGFKTIDQMRTRMKTMDHLLDELGIDLEDLAKRAGLEMQRMLAIADGRWTPSPKEREKLAAALGVAVTDISWGHTMNPRNVRYGRFGLKEDFGQTSGSK